MYEKEIDAAQAAARKAGALILEYYAKEIIAEEKLGIDNFYEPVTEADRMASRVIVDSLSAAFPDDAVLSEEEKDDPLERLTKKRTWIVDPIDGTAGFVQKDGDFAVHIGLAEDGDPIVGIVYLPDFDAMYYASKGQGSYVVRDGETTKLTVSEKDSFAQMKLALTRHHWSNRMNRVIKEFGFKDHCRRGSVGLKIGLIAETKCDIYIHLSPRTKIWDTCAPQIILEEAGGKLTDIFGSRMRYDIADLQNHNGIVASNGVKHEEVIKRLKPILTQFGRQRFRHDRKVSSKQKTS
jgi:3'(2'), 5'-bisphosphate nucleotidase